MVKKKSAVAKKRGRPTTIGATTRLALRFPDALVEAMDEWAKAAGVVRSEAARRLIEAGLKRRPKV
jgi:metal-responsive CopG/Arc/MetJ family transcriptional regulator